MTTLIFDTETTGLPANWNAGYQDEGNPDLLQLGMLVLDESRYPVYELGVLIYPYGNKPIDPKAYAAHGISLDNCRQYGRNVDEVLETFSIWAVRAKRIVAHNTSFDRLVMLTCAHRRSRKIPFFDGTSQICTMKTISAHTGGKWPKLDVAYREYVDPRGFPDAHNASADVWACTRLLWALEDRGFTLRGP